MTEKVASHGLQAAVQVCALQLPHRSHEVLATTFRHNGRDGHYPQNQKCDVEILFIGIFQSKYHLANVYSNSCQSTSNYNTRKDAQEQSQEAPQPAALHRTSQKEPDDRPNRRWLSLRLMPSFRYVSEKFFSEWD